MIDSHAHLYFDRFDADRDQVLERAREAGVEAVINIGIDAETSRAAVELAQTHDALYATAGLHPTSRVEDLDAELAAIEGLAREFPRAIVAIGEIGLDYYWDDVSHADQRLRLERQLLLARELGLPVVFHCRDALDDLIGLLETHPDLVGPGVFHCFGGDASDARRALALGYHVSFAGNVTYPKAESLREAARAVPIDRLLLETDSPFLAPQARRGQRNEPAFAVFTRDFLAELHGVEIEELERVTRRATVELFALDIKPRSNGLKPGSAR